LLVFDIDHLQWTVVGCDDMRVGAITDMNERRPAVAFVLGSALLLSDGIAFLTYEFEGADRLNAVGQPPTRYHVHLLDRSLVQKWQRAFSFEWQSEAPLMSDGKVVLDRSAPVGLTQREDVAGGGLVVCAGAKQHILELEMNSGDVLWRVERLWEYERGFTGPSAHMYYVSRFGVEEPDLFSSKVRNLHADPAPDVMARQDLFEASIVGGPVVCHGATSSYLLVAVNRVKGRDGIAADGVSQGVIYGLSWKGEVEALTMIPQGVRHGQVFPVSSGMVFGCVRTGCGRVKYADDEATRGEMRLELTWYREFSPRNGRFVGDGTVGHTFGCDGKTVIMVGNRRFRESRTEELSWEAALVNVSDGRAITGELGFRVDRAKDLAFQSKDAVAEVVPLEEGKLGIRVSIGAGQEEIVYGLEFQQHELWRSN
jgi:hypothetical protein